MANISWVALETSSATQMRSFPYEAYARRNTYCFTPCGFVYRKEWSRAGEVGRFFCGCLIDELWHPRALIEG